MYLEKLEIQGFKSFASSNKLIFPGLINDHKRGLTSIVGPNGSGKSNVADAIRWALGEQSIKTLRGKKSEDVIFSGSDQKSKLGMAEVSLYLNNQERASKNKDLAKDEPTSNLDQVLATCAEITITRRLFRNGESEYLLNGNRVRLLDIQLLLAKANFGQKTYSVIGQGMVENFLNTSTSERKDFFDEATGIKQFQIKRDSALNKLENSYNNLQQVEMLLAEISPRLRSLTRQVNKLEKRSQIEVKLKINQLDYYHQVWQEINDSLVKTNDRYLEKEKIKIEKDKKLKKLNTELNKLRNTNNYQEINDLKPELQKLYFAKNQFLKQLAKSQAELEINLEAHGQFDLSWLNSKQTELTVELEKIDGELKSLPNHSSSEQQLLSELTDIDKQLVLANQALQKIKQTTAVSKDQVDNKKKLSFLINNFVEKLETIEKETNLEKIKETIREIKNSFKEELEKLETVDNSSQLEGIKEVQAKIILLNENKQKIVTEINNDRFKLSQQTARQKLILEKKAEIIKDIEDIKNKIHKQSQPSTANKIEQEKEKVVTKINELNIRITELEKKTDSLNQAKEEEKSLIFHYQQNLQDLQNEINLLTTTLNNLKIEATRQETKLEDLEINIRNDELKLNEIKNHQLTNQEIDRETIQEKIISYKNQLELIGGIDPEIKAEYQETKERFVFLSEQTSDLSKAIKSLEQIIYELDTNIKNRFDKEFKIISENFNNYFKILFNGGQAKIVKIVSEDIGKINKKDTEEEEIKKETSSQLSDLKFLRKHSSAGLAGIDIQATPPGKKISAVAMLSGGERALTAIALICAIISANPSPFVVLDEVDAALDEANSARLADILDNLSHKTQFIVITHNRAIMNRANILYGVTMGSDGVSKLLSVKLTETKKYE